MPQPMTEEQRRTFLKRGTPSAVFATIGSNGYPHAVPMWFALDGDDILLNAGAETAKVMHLTRDRRVTILVHDDAPPYAFVMISGDAEVSHDPDEIRQGAERIAGRYLDGEAARGWIDYATSPGKVQIRVRPFKMVAIDRIAG